MTNRDKGINRNSSSEEKKETLDAIFENFSSVFFDRINFISHPFSLGATANAYGAPIAGVTSTASYNGSSRLTDTADGRFLTPSKNTRMRCNFYLTNRTKLDGYILSPVIYDSYSSLNSISSMDIFRAYIGLKFKDSKVYVAVKEAGGAEKTTEVDVSLFGTTYTDTMVLEILTSSTNSELYLNSKYLGSYSADFIGKFTGTKTYLPLLSPIKSTDGSSVNITIENYQFIQDK